MITCVSMPRISDYDAISTLVLHAGIVAQGRPTNHSHLVGNFFECIAHAASSKIAVLV